MINFVLPGMWERYKINLLTLGLLKNHPNLFIDNLNINAIYGNFSWCSWDGGRILLPDFINGSWQASYEDIVQIQYLYNNLFNVPIRFIFTNPILKPEHCLDRFNNLVLSLCENDINEIVINSPVLEEYIKTNYNYKHFISSTTKCLNTTNSFLEEFEKNQYDFICLDYNLNKNKKFLETIPENKRKYCEFLINSICAAACPYRKQHYELNGYYNLNYGRMYKLPGCRIPASTLLVKKERISVFTPDEVQEYTNNGFNHFKLEGRTFSDTELTLIFAKYLVKPEFQFAFIDFILSSINTIDLYNFQLENCFMKGV